jgi:hypothetical protein
MSAPALADIQQDRLAMSVARALAVANDAAAGQGQDPAQSLVTISEETAQAGRCWRIHYGPRDFARQRGGDLIIIVDELSGALVDLIHGQ